MKVTDSYAYYTDQLNPEYRAAFEQVQTYVTTSMVDENTVNSQLMQLVDVFLSAQNAGRRVESVTGRNIEQFCKNFCSQFGWEQCVRSVAERFRDLAIVVLILDGVVAVSVLLEESAIPFWERFLGMTENVMFFWLIPVMLLSTVFDLLIRRVMFRIKKGVVTALRITNFVLNVGLYMLLVSALPQLRVPSWICMAGSALYLLVYYVVIRIRKEQPANKVEFGDLVNAELDRTQDKEMQKAFARADKKHRRKHGAPLTFETFLDQQEEQCRKYEKRTWMSILSIGLVAVVFVIGMYLAGGFESLGDCLLFTALLGVIEFFICRFMLVNGRRANAASQRWITKQRENLQEMSGTEKSAEE